MWRAFQKADSEAGVATAAAYRPIIRGYFAVAAIYYAAMAISHFLYFEGSDLVLMGAVSIFALIACSAAFWLVRQDLPVIQLEFLITTINLLILANVLAALHVEFNTAKFVYFIMMAMIFAFASVSLLQALTSIAFALVALFWQVSVNDPGNEVIYAFVGFAAALSAVAIAFYLRRAISLAVIAREDANKALVKTEDRLADSVALSEKMRLRSISDSLTDLPNRRAFYNELQIAKRFADEEESWLLLLDLDGFKAVNDNHGHILGDELLKAVAIRLRDYCGEVCHVSRIGGDEFSIIYRSANANVAVADWTRNLLDVLSQTYLIEDRLIQISGSIGCYQIGQEEAEATLVQRADFALLDAKKSGKNRVVVFDCHHAEKAAEHVMIERALRDADFDAEIEVLFQPQFDLEQQKFVCAEALARWNSPSIGHVGPARFIRIAEETGLIANITITVLRKVIATLEAMPVKIPISVNLSAADLNSSQTIDELVDCLRRSSISSKLLEFEVTESAMMPDMARATANLRRLSALGHSIALDDFGTGYSNFTYLRSLPLDKLKVDRSFLENKSDPKCEKILASVVGIAKTLDVKCLIEGTESELDLLMAKRIGAHSVQGFVFGAPMPADLLQAVFENPGLYSKAG